MAGREGREDEKEADTCKICFERPVDCVIVDCGHVRAPLLPSCLHSRTAKVCACMECARPLKTCPMCRKAIVSVVKMFRA